MELKKHPKANLEKAKSVFFLVGIAVALVLVIGLFAWTTTDTTVEQLANNDENIDMEQVMVTQKEKEPTKPKPQEQQISDKIEIVEDEIKIEDAFDFDTEADEETSTDFLDMDYDDGDDEVVVEEVFFVAEKMPVFPGGEAALRGYIAENVDYPELARENEIQGTVYVRFVVTKSGKVGEVVLLRGVDQLLDDAAVDVVKTLPPFTPGEQRGKKVSVWYTVPITFQLSN